MVSVGWGAESPHHPSLIHTLHTWPRETPKSSLGGIGGATVPTTGLLTSQLTSQRLFTAAFQHLMVGEIGPESLRGWDGHTAWGGGWAVTPGPGCSALSTLRPFP